MPVSYTHLVESANCATDSTLLDNSVVSKLVFVCCELLFCAGAEEVAAFVASFWEDVFEEAVVLLPVSYTHLDVYKRQK